MEKLLPPPTVATWQREESSRSGARRPQSGIFVVGFLLGFSLLLLLLLTRSKKEKKPKKFSQTFNQKGSAFSLLIMSSF